MNSSGILNYFDISNNFYLNSLSFFATSEFFTIIFIFNFMQLIISSAISELVWPTQLFNRQNTIGFKAFRLRTYTETVTKLLGYSVFYRIFNKGFYKFK